MELMATVMTSLALLLIPTCRVVPLVARVPSRSLVPLNSVESAMRSISAVSSLRSLSM
jgi:hypothetical protein